MNLISFLSVGSYCTQEVVSRFSGDLESVAAGEYDGWATPYDKLAAILVADQLTRCSPRDFEA